MPIPIPKCEKCEAEMILREKGTDKFWGCPNWKKCHSKTKPYDGVDKPKPTENETLARMEMKLDYLIDILKTPEQPKDYTQSLKEILQVKDIPLPDNEIKASDIPF